MNLVARLREKLLRRLRRTVEAPGASDRGAYGNDGIVSVYGA